MVLALNLLLVTSPGVSHPPRPMFLPRGTCCQPPHIPDPSHPLFRGHRAGGEGDGGDAGEKGGRGKRPGVEASGGSEDTVAADCPGPGSQRVKVEEHHVLSPHNLIK